MSGYVQKNRKAFRRLMQMFRRDVRINAWAVCDEWLMRANFEAGFHDGIHETALLVGICPRTLDNWRSQGPGPRHCRVGRRCVYRGPTISNLRFLA